jgi:hypothetical protein
VVPGSSIFTARKPNEMTYSYKELSASKLKPFGSFKVQNVIGDVSMTIDQSLFG